MKNYLVARDSSGQVVLIMEAVGTGNLVQDFAASCFAIGLKVKEEMHTEAEVAAMKPTDASMLVITVDDATPDEQLTQ